jgi:mono/diheme cytochrome c family protein
MKLRVLWLLMSLTVFFSAGCNKLSSSTNNDAKPTPSAAATPDPFALARGTFSKDCQECHGQEGKGGPVKLKDGTRLRVPSLREGHALRHPNSEYVKQITQGGDGMPAFKDKLNQAQIDELINFIRHDFQGGMTPPPEKDTKTK